MLKKYSVTDIISLALYWIFWVCLIIYAVSMVVLPIYMLITSLKLDNLECVYNPFGLPEQPTWSNYKEIFVIFEERLEVSVVGMFGVSILTSVLKPFLGVFFTTLFA